MNAMFTVTYARSAAKYYSKLDKNEQEQIQKKIEKLKMIGSARHLRNGLPHYVIEAGQNRICYREFGSTRRIEFIGNHKQYEEWLDKQELE